MYVYTYTVRGRTLKVVNRENVSQRCFFERTAHVTTLCCYPCHRPRDPKISGHLRDESVPRYQVISTYLMLVQTIEHIHQRSLTACYLAATTAPCQRCCYLPTYFAGITTYRRSSIWTNNLPTIQWLPHHRNATMRLLATYTYTQIHKKLTVFCCS